jgi:Tfp pilus assembly protein PilF/RNA polymerase subunit RPABC4/transcription elongation factor Spt4
MIKCDNCGFIADEKFNFCPNCGSPLIKNETTDQQSPQNKELKSEIVICDVCGENTKSENGVCEFCGAKLTDKEKFSESKGATEVKVNEVPDKIKKEKIGDGQKKKVARTNSKESQKKQSSSVAGTRNLTNTQVLLISGGILVVVFIMLLASGVFDTNDINTTANHEAGTNTESKIDLSQLQQINSLEKIVNSDTTNLNNVLDLAHRLNDSGFYEKAIGYYQMYLRHNPKNPDVQIDLGVCYFEIKRYEIAKEEMLKGIRIDPKHQIGLFNLGVVNLAQGNLDSAKFWWKKTLEINENSDIAKRAKQLLESH